jgi:hypothetical protein
MKIIFLTVMIMFSLTGLVLSAIKSNWEVLLVSAPFTIQFMYLAFIECRGHKRQKVELVAAKRKIELLKRHIVKLQED